MGAFSGPETVDDGIVLALDAQNPLSVGNTTVNVWEDVSSSTTTVRSVGVITCLSIDTASSSFFGQKYSSCLISGSTVWDNRPPSVSDMNEILSGNLTCKSYQTGTYDQVQYLFGSRSTAGNICTLRFTGFGVGAVIGVGGYFNAVTRQCRLTGDLLNSPVTITSPSGGFADPIVLTSDPADIQFSNPGSSGDPMYVYWLGPYNQVPYNTLRSSYGTLTNGPVFTQEPKLEPFGGAGAVSFDGTGDYLSIPDSTDLDFGSGDFTIECWVYPDSGSTNGAFITKRSSTAYFAPFVLRQINTTSLAVLMSTSGSSWNFNQTATSALTTDAWQHVAVTRSGTAIKAFVNGTEVISSTLSGALMTNTQIAVIGTDFAYDLDGKISNLRVVKGTALYTSNFTPKRQPLLPESAPNTVLLTCQKGTIKDRSSSAHAITVNGDAKSISGASYFEFDGTDDYVSVASSSDFNLGTGDFTVECFVYLQDITSNSGYVGIVNRHNYTNSTGWGIWKETGGKFGFWYNAATQINGTSNVATNQWYHIAAVRNGSTISLYVNGVFENSGSNSSFTDASNQLNIGIANAGGVWNAAYPLNGKVSNLRILKGKGLTAAEVKQNYRNTKGRYGL